MLFDLKGKRRRMIQVIYLTLAILMGGGLVLFGIGGNTSGGLFDAFSGGGGGEQSASAAAGQLKAANAALAKDPEDADALADKVRAAFQLSKENVNTKTGAPTATSTKYQNEAADAWESYLELKPQPPPDDGSAPGPKQPDVSLAGYMVQIYDVSGLNEPEKAARAAELVAGSRPTVGAYLKLTQYAAAAGQTRTADLAASKAIELAEPSQKKAVEKQAQAYKEAGEKQAEQSSAQAQQAADGAKAGGSTEAATAPAKTSTTGK
jgi:hypothetical protein